MGVIMHEMVHDSIFSKLEGKTGDKSSKNGQKCTKIGNNGQKWAKKHQILCALGILPIFCFCPIPADSPLLLLRGNYRQKGQKWAKRADICA